MSTITTTAPSFEAPRTSGRRILVAGAIVAGLVVAGAVAVPRLTAQTAPSPSYPAVTPHDAVEHQLDTARSAAAGAAARQQSERVQRRMDLGAKQIAAVTATQAYQPMAFQPALEPGFTRAYVGGQLQTVAVPRMVERSVIQEQTGQLGHYAWSPTSISSVQKEQTGQQGHYAYLPQAHGLPSVTTTNEQVGGKHATYAYVGRTLHLTWTDPWVPPYDNPEWVPYIKSHYFHPVTTRVAPTHEYR